MCHPPGYALSGPDNNAEMFSRDGGWDACPGCGAFGRRNEINPDFTLDVAEDELIDYGMGEIEEPASHADAKRIFDCSCTYDGRMIVSTAFRDAVVQCASTMVEFGVLPREPNFFVLRPSAILAMDAERNDVAFEPLCNVCGGSTGAHGSLCYLRQPDQLDPFGMYRSDAELGGPNSMRPDVLVGPELAHHLRPLNGVNLYWALRW